MRQSFIKIFYADDFTLNGSSVAGGPLISLDELTTINGGAAAANLKVQRMKVGFGADGDFKDVSASNGLPISGSQSANSTASWTSATALNTVLSLTILNLNTVSLAVMTTTTITAGALTFEISPDNVNWYAITLCRMDTYKSEKTYALIASTLQAWSGSVDAFSYFRVRLSTAITGTGTVSLAIGAQVFAIEPMSTVGQSDATQLLATVTQNAITKGTQGATGVTTQDLKDAGRSARTILLDSFAVAATAETLMTMSFSTDNGTATTGTSYTVTSGKRLRIQFITVNLHTITGNTTAVNVIVRMRVNNAGAALVSSPIQLVIPIQGVAAVNQAGVPIQVPIPDGWEFVAGAGIGFTVACAGFVATTAAPKVDISVVGYEY